jgi:hypothetical protein
MVITMMITTIFALGRVDTRISFGKESLWEDLDVVGQILLETFVNECMGICDVSSSEELVVVAAASQGGERRKV